MAGFHPIDRIGQGFRNFASNLTEHPFQAAATFGANRLFPGAGAALNRFVFQPRNNQATAQNLTGSLNQTIGRQNQAIMDKPLNGPLGSFDGMGRGEGNNNDLAQALLGAQSPRGNPNQGALNGGAYNVRQFGSPIGQPSNSGSGVVDSIMNGLPGGSQFDPNFGQSNGGSGRLQAIHNGGGAALDAMYNSNGLSGVSNFMVGGSPVINGVMPGMGNYNRFGGSNQGYVKGRNPGN